MDWLVSLGLSVALVALISMIALATNTHRSSR
jgi:hypothetical protein